MTFFTINHTFTSPMAFIKLAVACEKYLFIVGCVIRDDLLNRFCFYVFRNDFLDFNKGGDYFC